LTPRSDVFALGVVLYELLTGQHPFGRAVTANQRDDQMRVIPPRVVKPTIPHGLDAICMRALAHDARDRYGRMQQLIDALVEERFANGYREGASDLAQAIREVAPKSDIGAPRTMHTDRPVTIVTRSLLREITPPRRGSAPSHPSAPDAPPRRASSPTAPPPPVAPYPLGPLDPPPRDAFPMQPTIGPQVVRRLAEDLPPPNGFPMEPTMGVQTTAMFAEPPPPDDFPMQPSSGSQTMAREIDQVALAEAARAAAAMFQLPNVLRVEGTPIPAFRMSTPALEGDELASVVGGHTMTGHGGAVAVEPRGHRWTIAVLAAAALIGVGAAVAIQLTPGHDDGLMQLPPSHASTPPATSPEPSPARAEQSPGPAEAAQVTPPAAAQPAAQPSGQPTATDTSVPPNTAPASPEAAPASPEVAPVPPAAAPAPPATVPASDSTVPGAAPSTEPRTPDGRPNSQRPANRETGKHKEPGILSVQSVPWSWVTVAGQRKETPDKFYLPPGTYVVKFYNQDNGVRKTEHVTIEAGKRLNLNEEMEP
jgi:hypothetical protein